MRGIAIPASRSERDAVLWRLYAGRLGDAATLDLEAPAERIADAEFELREPTKRQRQSYVRDSLARDRARLREARAKRAEVRELLWPPDETDPETATGVEA